MRTGQKRVLFIQTQAENAGAQEISRLLGQGLSAQGHDIHHLFFYRKTAGFDDLENGIICCKERPSGPLEIAAFFKGLVKTIKDIDPDIVFTFQHFGNVIGAPAARLAGVKKVIANQVSARETINPIVRAFDLMFGVTGVYGGITVNSRSLLRDYESFPKSYLKRMAYVPHGFEDKTKDIDKKEAREKYNLPMDVPLLGTVARLNEAKQIDCALRLLKKEPTWRLVIAGQGPDEGRLRSIASQTRVSDRVIFLGELSQDSVGEVLASLDVFVFPSRAETFGLAAVEAGQAGIPVVANKIDVLQEVLEIKGLPCATFVDVQDTNAFATAVRTLLEEPDYYHEMQKRGYYLKRKYSLEAMVASYARMLSGVQPTLLRKAKVSTAR